MKTKHIIRIVLLTLTLFVGNQASAAIVYSGIRDVIYSRSNSNPTFSLFNAPGNWDDIYLVVTVSEDSDFQNQYDFQNYRNAHGNYVEFAVGVDSSFFDIINFSTGDSIDETSVWSGNNYKRFSYFRESFEPPPSFISETGEFRNTTGYAGLRLTDGANVYYGWMQVSVTNYNNRGITGTLTGWAYDNTPGQAIQAGAIPEPSTAGLLFGAAAISCLVRRRRK